MNNMMASGMVVVFGVVYAAIEAAVVFGIVYTAARLAIRHERRVRAESPSAAQFP